MVSPGMLGWVDQFVGFDCQKYKTLSFTVLFAPKDQEKVDGGSKGRGEGHVKSPLHPGLSQYS